MENMNMAVLPCKAEEDSDCFLRLCNSPEQQLRRQMLRKRDRRKRVAVSAAKYLLAAVVGAAALTAILSLVWGCVV